MKNQTAREDGRVLLREVIWGRLDEVAEKHPKGFSPRAFLQENENGLNTVQLAVENEQVDIVPRLLPEGQYLPPDVFTKGRESRPPLLDEMARRGLLDRVPALIGPEGRLAPARMKGIWPHAVRTGQVDHGLGLARGAVKLDPQEKDRVIRAAAETGHMADAVKLSEKGRGFAKKDLRPAHLKAAVESGHLAAFAEGLVSGTKLPGEMLRATVLHTPRFGTVQTSLATELAVSRQLPAAQGLLAPGEKITCDHIIGGTAYLNGAQKKAVLYGRAAERLPDFLAAGVFTHPAQLKRWRDDMPAEVEKRFGGDKKLGQMFAGEMARLKRGRVRPGALPLREGGR